MQPSPHVLDLFAVPDSVRPLRGGRGGSVVAGDLVLSPGRDATTAQWLNPVLARLAVDLDTWAARGVRIAMPIPSRDGRWVVEGWGASRFEPDTTHCHDLDVLVATGRLVHAELQSVVTERPKGLGRRTDRWAAAERAAFGPREDAAALVGDAAAGPLVQRLLAERVDARLGPNHLVHADLAGNVLLDARGGPVVIDFAPAWRPGAWAEAVCVLDSVLWHGADPSAMARWAEGTPRQAMVRAALFRILSDSSPDLAHVRRYAEVLGLSA